MKKSLDLTRDNDFNPSKFKKSDNKDYNDGKKIYRTPWNKNGTLLGKPKKLSSLRFEFTSTVNNVWPTSSSILLNYFTDDYNLYNTQYRSIYNYDDFHDNISNITSTNMPFINNNWYYLDVERATYVYYGINCNNMKGLRIGKVRDIKYSSYNNEYKPSYVNRIHNIVAHNVSNKYDNYKVKSLLRKNRHNSHVWYDAISVANTLHEGYYDNMYDNNIIINDYDHHRTPFNIESSRRHRRSDVPRKIVWFDRHQEYIREEEGMSIRKEWRGITDLKKNKSNPKSKTDYDTVNFVNASIDITSGNNLVFDTATTV